MANRCSVASTRLILPSVPLILHSRNTFSYIFTRYSGHLKRMMKICMSVWGEGLSFPLQLNPNKNVSFAIHYFHHNGTALRSLQTYIRRVEQWGEISVGAKQAVSLKQEHGKAPHESSHGILSTTASNENLFHSTLWYCKESTGTISPEKCSKNRTSFLLPTVCSFLICHQYEKLKAGRRIEV